MRSTVASLVVVLLFGISSARAVSSHDDLVNDAAALAQLEQRAEHAEAREQAFLFTELLQVYTQMAGKQMADGELEKASATLKRMQHCTSMIHASLAKDTKKLKDAEMMMHSASYRLGQYIHLVSTEDQVEAQATLRELNKVHEELLAQVFAH